MLFSGKMQTVTDLSLLDWGGQKTRQRCPLLSPLSIPEVITWWPELTAR